MSARFTAGKDGGGGAGATERTPQSVQSEPSSHASYCEPSPPSSQRPSAGYAHESPHGLTSDLEPSTMASSTPRRIRTAIVASGGFSVRMRLVPRHVRCRRPGERCQREGPHRDREVELRSTLYLLEVGHVP
eukprot:3213116-Prymnesium_polylepis.1